jgi:hypothetical protein
MSTSMRASPTVRPIVFILNSGRAIKRALSRGCNAQRPRCHRADARPWRKIGGNLYVPGQSEPFQQLTEVPAEIDLARIKAMPRRARKGMMITVPAFAHGRYRHQRPVVRLDYGAIDRPSCGPCVCAK